MSRLPPLVRSVIWLSSVSHRALTALRYTCRWALAAVPDSDVDELPPDEQAPRPPSTRAAVASATRSLGRPDVRTRRSCTRERAAVENVPDHHLTRSPT